MDALLVTLDFDRRGGLEGYSVELAHAFRRLGWNVECVSALASGRTRFEEIARTGLMPVSAGVWRKWLVRRWQWLLRAHLAARRARPDLVVALHPYVLPLVGPWARRRDVPHMGWVHGFEVWADWPDDLGRALHACEHLVAVSRYTAASVQRRRAPEARPVAVLYPAVDTTRFVPGSASEPPRALRLLTVGRLNRRDRYKGHERVMAALPQLERRLGRPVEYHIVGEGDDRPWIAAQARAHGVGDRVRVLGRLPMAALVDAYRSCDVFVMPSRVARRPDGSWTGEGFGVVFAEAAACGKPVVALAQGGVPEAVAHGETGLLCGDDPAELTGALWTLLSDPVLRARMGAAGRRMAERRFSRAALDAALARVVRAVGVGRAGAVAVDRANGPV